MKLNWRCSAWKGRWRGRRRRSLRRRRHRTWRRCRWPSNCCGRSTPAADSRRRWRRRGPAHGKASNTTPTRRWASRGGGGRWGRHRLPTDWTRGDQLPVWRRRRCRRPARRRSPTIALKRWRRTPCRLYRPWAAVAHYLGVPPTLPPHCPFSTINTTESKVNSFKVDWIHQRIDAIISTKVSSWKVGLKSTWIKVKWKRIDGIKARKKKWDCRCECCHSFTFHWFALDIALASELHSFSRSILW